MDKKYTAEEAARAVLAKAEEMLKSSKLAKGKVMSDMDHGQKRGPEGYGKYQEQAQNQKGVHTPVSGVTGFPGAKGQSAAGDMATQTYGGKPHKELREHGKDLHRKKLSEMKAMPAPNLPKSEDASMAASQDQTPPDGVQSQQAPEANPAEQKENGNPAWGTEPGHYKLAKFIGHRDGRRKAKGSQNV